MCLWLMPRRKIQRRQKATAKDEEVTPAAPEPEAKAEEVSAFEGFEYTEVTLTAETAEEMKDTAVSWTPSLQLN